MTSITTFARNAIAASGAMLLSIAFITAAVGPAAVHQPAIAYSTASVQVEA